MPNEVLNFNVYNILILCGSIQGILFGVAVLFWERYRSTPNYYLAQVILYLSLNNLFYWFADTRLGFRISYFYHLYIPWILLVLPYYYFFVATYLRKELSSRKKLWLRLPFIVSLCIHAFLAMNKLVLNSVIAVPEKLIKLFYIGEEYVSAIFTFGVIVLVYRLIKNYEKEQHIYTQKQPKIDTKWLKKILYFGILISTIWIVLVLYNDANAQNFFTNNSKYFLWGTASILIYWMGYLGIYHNDIFKQRRVLRNEVLLTVPDTTIESPKVKLNFSRFSEIDSYIKTQKLFLDPSLSLATLETHFNLSEGYISQLINNFSGGNFASYINKLRVEQAKVYLQNSAYEHYTIVSIALESGFNSKSAFYTAFKKVTGISPSEYKRQSLS